MLSRRRRKNSLGPIMVNGTLVEGVIPVRQVVFHHFSGHFKAPLTVRPSVEELHFQTLSYSEGCDLGL